MSYKPDPNKNINLKINGIPVTVPEGTRILEAARKVNIKIPILCDHPDLCKRAWCRICVVEAKGSSKLIAACANDVWEGAEITTHNFRVIDVRKTIIELILANHPQDCLICVKNKKCELQTLAQEHGIRDLPFESTDNNPSVSQHPVIKEKENLVRDMNKCIKCGRCVEVCHTEKKLFALNTSGRSHDFAIVTPYNQALENTACDFCKKCAEVCPVGAIYVEEKRSVIIPVLRNCHLAD